MLISRFCSVSGPFQLIDPSFLHVKSRFCWLNPALLLPKIPFLLPERPNFHGCFYIPVLTVALRNWYIDCGLQLSARSAQHVQGGSLPSRKIDMLNQNLIVDFDIFFKYILNRLPILKNVWISAEKTITI